MTHEHILMLTALLFYIAAIYLVYAFISKIISMIRSYLFHRQMRKTFRKMWEIMHKSTGVSIISCGMDGLYEKGDDAVCSGEKCCAKVKIDGTKRSAKRAKKNPARAKKQ